jgi:deoxyribonuclease V
MDIKIHSNHAFKVSPGEAIRIQQHLREKVVTGGKVKPLRYAAGVDVSFREGVATAAVAVINIPGLQLCDAAVARHKIEFPYIPGLLSFREIPVVLDVLKKIHVIPDVILCDGQGIAHPRRLGIASHLGVLTGMRTIGVAKSRLTGIHDEMPVRKGEWVPLYDKNETIGAVLCTRDNVKPLYISIGHRVDLHTAIKVVMRCVTRYRLPETTRLAHRLAGQAGVGIRPD